MENSGKYNQILEAAIRRFAHFGFHKTTLTEIADDLHVTKQALAHYFPDKRQLVDAVEQTVINDFLSTVENQFSLAPTASHAMMQLVEVKKLFLEKYAMLMHAAGAELLRSDSKMDGARGLVRNGLVKLIAGRLEQGMASGELKAMQPTEVAALVSDTVDAFEQCAITPNSIPDADLFANVCARQKAVLQLMMNGLKNN